MSKSTKINLSVTEYDELKEEYKELQEIVNSFSIKIVLIAKLIEFTNKIYCKGYSNCVKDYNL